MSKLDQTEARHPRDDGQSGFRYDRKARRDNQAHQSGRLQRAWGMCHIPDTHHHNQDKYDQPFEKYYSVVGESRRSGSQKDSNCRL